jgi:ribonuclease VapC
MKSIAVDSSALIAIVLEEPAAPKMLPWLTTCEQTFISTATWLETKIFVNVGAPQRVATLLAIMEMLAYEFVTVPKVRKVRHAAALNFGDCISYAMFLYSQCCNNALQMLHKRLNP